MPHTVTITTTGRGGGIEYSEQGHRIGFSWEFAMSPAVVLIFGTTTKSWDREYPWATGRAEEIYDLVGAEVVRQKASGCSWTVDVEQGVLEILRRGNGKREGGREEDTGTAAAAHSAGFERFAASVVPVWETWAEGQRYDVLSLKQMRSSEVDEVVELLSARDLTWREVEALAAIDRPLARAAVDAASKHHLSIDTRLAAAAAMHNQGRMTNEELELFLARQIRHLSQPRNGLERALEMAALHPSEIVKQALLWASYNGTVCAPRCAALLLMLKTPATEPFDEPAQAILKKLGLHVSSYERDEGFAKLCVAVGMTLVPSDD